MLELEFLISQKMRMVVDVRSETRMDVQEIYENIHAARREVTRWEEELKKFQAKCEHMYVRTRDDDYHASKYIYTCKKCHTCTWMCPERFEVDR